MQAGKQRKRELTVAPTAWNNPVPVAPISWRDINSGPRSHAMTTDSLEDLRNSRNGSLGRMLSVNITPVVGGVASAWLPSISQLYHADTQVEGECAHVKYVSDLTKSQMLSMNLFRH